MASPLTKALNRILHWLEQNRADYIKYLQPGLSKGDIDNLVQDLPFQLPSEVYDLYQWKNGALLPKLPEDHYLYEKGLIFKPSWSFRPLQEVVEICLENFNKEKLFDSYINFFPDGKVFRNKFDILPIFYTISYYNIDDYCSGSLWINQEQGLNPVIFNDFQEGENVLEKYSSLTSMMLTIAECYEVGIYDQYYFGKYDESENIIWRKYNYDLREFALQVLQEKSCSRKAWTYIVYELVDSKDSIMCQYLIQWLSNLINAYKESNHIKFFRGIDLKLYRKNQDNVDYFQLETGLAKLLGEIGDIKAVPILITALKDDNLFQTKPFSRICTAKALGKLKDTRATFPLIEVLSSDWDEARKAAAWALGEIQDLAAIEPLAKVLQDENRKVRAIAQAALLKIGG